MIWQLWFNLLPPCPALLCMSHTLNSTQVSSNVVKWSTKKRQRVLVRLSIHILFISLTLWMPTCPSFVGIIFQKHSGRMKRQNVVHESPAGVSKCVNSQRNLSQMSHRVKTFLRMSHRVKACLASCSAAGLPCRQIFANIYLTEISVKVKPLPKRTKNKHGQVASFWTRSKMGSINLEH